MGECLFYKLEYRKKFLLLGRKDSTEENLHLLWGRGRGTIVGVSTYKAQGRKSTIYIRREVGEDLVYIPPTTESGRGGSPLLGGFSEKEEGHDKKKKKGKRSKCPSLWKRKSQENFFFSELE